MNAKTVVKVVQNVGMACTLVGSLAGSWANKKIMEETIVKEVAKAAAKQ